MELSVPELRFLAHLAVEEGAQQFAERVLRDEHQGARDRAKEHGGPVRGVCPTMVRDPAILAEGYKGSAIDGMELAERLNAKADEIEKGGPYR